MKKIKSIDEQSDIKLYKSFLNGNNEDFNALIIKYRKELTYFIMTYVRNIDIAEDIAQDTFVYMIVNKKEYDFKYSFKTYLYTIAKSRALNYIKKNKKLISIEDVFFCRNDLDIDLENDFIQKEYYNEIRSSIKKLKKDYQIIIYLYDFQGFKYKEISKILNQNISKTKMLIHRARKALKNILKGEK